MRGKRKPQAPRRKGSPRGKSKRQFAPRKTQPVVVSRLSKRSLAAQNRSFHTLADARHGVPLPQALRENGVTLRTFKKYLGSEIRQSHPGGRITVTKTDQRVRYLQIPGLHGPIDVGARGWAEARRAARYKALINRFLGGDLKAVRALKRWKGKKIAGVELLTDPKILKSLAQDELLPYALYRSFSGGAA